MGQGDSAGDFDPSEGIENAGILDVFPIFHTARLGQKIRRSPQLPPKRCCLKTIHTLLISKLRPDSFHNILNITEMAANAPVLYVRTFNPIQYLTGRIYEPL